MPATAPQSRQVQLAHGRLDWIEAGPSSARHGDTLAPLVLLHGIGSCAASWRDLLPMLSAERRVLAWDAPGYAGSAPLPMDQPRAADYADAALAWLAVAEVKAPIVLGHSLGALMAAALAARSADKIGALLLASPAQGYATAAPAVREAKFNERVTALRSLGIERLAHERSARLCAPGAPAAIVARVRDNMLQIRERGYVQAAWMLAHDHIDAHLAAARAPLALMCGALDAVTQAEPSRLLAERHGAPFRLLPGLGHACYVEDAASFAAAVDAALSALSVAPTKARHA